MMLGPNFSIFSWPRPWMVLSSERGCGRARTMLRRVVEARTKKRGRFSLSDSALRHSRRRWSRACCSGVRVSAGSGVGVRGRVKVSTAGEFTPKAKALGYPEATAGATVACGVCDSFGRDDELVLGTDGGLSGASERQREMM